MILQPSRGPPEITLVDTWMNGSQSGWQYRGDRINGLRRTNEMHRIRIVEEVVKDERVWVVDVVRKKFSPIDPTYILSRIYCDGCEMVRI